MRLPGHAVSTLRAKVRPWIVLTRRAAKGYPLIAMDMSLSINVSCPELTSNGEASGEISTAHFATDGGATVATSGSTRAGPEASSSEDAGTSDVPWHLENWMPLLRGFYQREGIDASSIDLRARADAKALYVEADGTLDDEEFDCFARVNREHDLVRWDSSEGLPFVLVEDLPALTERGSQ